MPRKEKRGHGGTRKYGRNLAKCKQYRAMKTREKNKLKRILQSNGKAYAESYALGCGLSTYLKGLM